MNVIPMTTNQTNIGAGLSAFLSASLEATDKHNRSPRSPKRVANPTTFPYDKLWEFLAGLNKPVTQGEINKYCLKFSRKKDKAGKNVIPDAPSLERQIFREVALFRAALHKDFFTQSKEAKTYYFLNKEAQEQYQSLPARWEAIGGLVTKKQPEVSIRYVETAIKEITKGKQKIEAKKALLQSISSTNYASISSTKKQIKSLWEKVYLPLASALKDSNSKEKLAKMESSFEENLNSWSSARKAQAPTQTDG